MLAPFEEEPTQEMDPQLVHGDDATPQGQQLPSTVKRARPRDKEEDGRVGRVVVPLGATP